MEVLLYAIAKFLISIIEWLEYALMAYIILGWVVFFGLIKNNNSIILKIYVFLLSKIEPVLSRIRRFLPPLFGFDFSPMVIFFGLYLVKIVIIQVVYSIFNNG